MQIAKILVGLMALILLLATAHDAFSQQLAPRTKAPPVKTPKLPSVIDTKQLQRPMEIRTMCAPGYLSSAKHLQGSFGITPPFCAAILGEEPDSGALPHCLRGRELKKWWSCTLDPNQSNLTDSNACPGIAKVFTDHLPYYYVCDYGHVSNMPGEPQCAEGFYPIRDGDLCGTGDSGFCCYSRSGVACGENSVFTGSNGTEFCCVELGGSNNCSGGVSIVNPQGQGPVIVTPPPEPTH